MKWRMGEKMRGFSIRTKLFLIMSVAVVLALLLLSTALVVNEKWRAEKNLVKELRAMADVVALNSGAAMAFNDRTAAGENLASLAAISEIVVAVLYDRKGRVFSTYSRSEGSPEARIRELYPDKEEILKELYEEKEIIFLSGSHLHVLRPVIEKGRRVGAIHLVDDMRQVEARLGSYCILLSFIVAVTLVVVLLLSTRMQKIVTGPLFDLIHSMTEVTRKKNYTLRMIKRSNDEFGTLIDRFNDKLGEIEARYDELKAYRSDLEKRVALRTAASGRMEKDEKAPYGEVAGGSIEKTDPYPIDRKMLDALADLQTEGAPDVVRGVVRAYLADSESVVFRLGQAVAAGDRKILRRASHSLKSSSANVGATALSEMSRTLEAHCRETIPGNAPELVAVIETEFSRVKEALEKEIGSR